MSETVLVSGFGDDGRGGILALRDGDIELLDSVPCTGLTCDGARVGRLLRSPGERTSIGELVVSDASGVVEYRRLDGVRDPHDLAAVDGGWLVVSTGTNEIVEVGGQGVRTVWKGPDVPDSWHVNCVTRAGDDLWATAFGRFDTFKGWRGEHARGTGVLWNLRTGEEIGGLSHPHTPRLLGGRWVVCESIAEALVRYEPDGSAVQRRELGGYTRGTCVAGNTLLVGVSARRDATGRDAHIAVLDADSFAVLDRIPVPCAEIYDLVTVPRELADGVRTGFATNAFRVARHRHDLLTALGTMPPARLEVGDAVATGEIGCRVRAVLPATAATGSTWVTRVEVENVGRAWLGSVDPHPVLLASRWLGPGGAQVDGERAPLPAVLAPGQRTIAALPLTAPGAGSYRLVISLVVEGAFWFDDLDPDFGCAAEVRVT